MVGFVGTGVLWLQNDHDEWIHDVYEESHIHYGTIYSLDKSFHPSSISITGYFQDNVTKQWIKVVDGAARMATDKWVDRLEDLLQTEMDGR